MYARIVTHDTFCLTLVYWPSLGLGSAASRTLEVRTAASVKRTASQPHDAHSDNTRPHSRRAAPLVPAGVTDPEQIPVG